MKTTEVNNLAELRERVDLNETAAWWTLGVLRRWAELTGNYPVAEAVDRFIRFLHGEDDAA